MYRSTWLPWKLNNPQALPSELGLFIKYPHYHALTITVLFMLSNRVD